MALHCYNKSSGRFYAYFELAMKLHYSSLHGNFTLSLKHNSIQYWKKHPDEERRLVRMLRSFRIEIESAINLQFQEGIEPENIKIENLQERLYYLAKQYGVKRKFVTINKDLALTPLHHIPVLKNPQPVLIGVIES